MHDTGWCSHNIPTKDLPYALMPHAHPKDGEFLT